ncbi:MAG: hypothetical protein GY778_02675 [bacterium]|nr:hypothetical protein [bacterium]
MGDVGLPQIVGDGAADPGDRTGLFGLTDSALAGVLAQHRQQRFRGTQILEWVYGRGAASFDEMTNLPKGLRATLAEALDVYQSQLVRRSESRDGTIKLVLRCWEKGGQATFLSARSAETK